MTDFENKIRESLEDYSVPNAVPDWDVFEQKLDNANKRKKGNGFIAAAVIGLIAGLAFVYNTDTTDTVLLAATSNTSVESPIEIKTNETTNKANKTTKLPNEIANVPEDNVDELINVGNAEIDAPESRILVNPSARLMMNDEDIAATNLNPIEPTQADQENNPNYIAKKPSEVIASKKVSCIGEEVQFSTNDHNCSYIWDFGDGTQGFDKIQSHTYEFEGTYRVAVTITSKKTRKSTFAYRADIKVAANPVADFDYTDPDWSQCETDHQFVSTSVDAYKQAWFIGEEKLSDVSSLDYMFFTKGYYEVALVTENIYGCKNSYSQNITIEEDYNLGAANAFTPNNDGRNDEWLPAHLQCLGNEFNLVITNMQSLVVFQTNSTENKWDGTIKGSAEVARPGETYAWTATYIDKKGITRMAKGSIAVPSL